MSGRIGAGLLAPLVLGSLAVGGVAGWLLRAPDAGTGPRPTAEAEVEDHPRFLALLRENERLREERDGMRLAFEAAAPPAEPEAGADGGTEPDAEPERTRPGPTAEEIRALEREIEGIAYHLEGDPTNVDLLRKLVETSARIGDYDGAIAKLEALLEKRPDSPDLLTQLGRAFLMKTRSTTNRMKQGELAFTAIRRFDAALEKDPEHFDARLNRAALNYHMPAFLKRTGEAVKDLETLVEQGAGGAGDDRYRVVYRYLGRAYEKAGRADDAKRVRERALEVFPDDARLAAELRGSD